MLASFSHNKPSAGFQSQRGVKALRADLAVAGPMEVRRGDDVPLESSVELAADGS